MVWGAIGYNYRSQIIFLEKSVDSDYYIEKVIFESNFIDDTDKCWGIGNWVFQQDNAPAHKSQTTLAVLKELGNTHTAKDSTSFHSALRFAPVCGHRPVLLLKKNFYIK